MRTINLKNEITKAVNDDPAADESVRDFWEDTKLTLGVRAAVADSQGVATLVPDGKDTGVVVGMPLNWDDLDVEWAEWNELGHSSPRA